MTPGVLITFFSALMWGMAAGAGFQYAVLGRAAFPVWAACLVCALGTRPLLELITQ